jgi:thioredoxin reductase (NADPH)
MLTIEDVSAVPLFSALPAADRERLARTSADLHLGPGEFAVHEGGEPALFAVLSGKIQVIKTIDGIERTLGWRVTGAIFGEVPIALGTPFPGAYRAAEPSRVMRVELQEYCALVAASKEVSQTVGALARADRGAADHCRRAASAARHRGRSALGSGDRQLAPRPGPQPDFVQLVRARCVGIVAALAGNDAAGGNGPAVRLADGHVMFGPQVRDLTNRLGLRTSARSAEYDVAVIGGGPAGLAAAVYGASEGLRTVVIEREVPGGQAGMSSRIENYLGFPNGISGDELASRALQQARRLGAEILVTRLVARIDPATREVALDGGGDVVRARTIILATGVSWRRLAIDGFDRLIGKGVYYGAERSEAGAVHGLDVFLVGAGNSAGQAALYFANHARQVTLLVRGDSLEKSMSYYLVEQLRARENVAVQLRSEIRGIHGDTHVTAIDIGDSATAEVRRHGSGGLFIFIGADAETEWLPPEIARDARGYVLTGDDLKKAGRWPLSRDPYLLETSVPGIFACGDVRLSPVKRVAAAVGEGSMAIAFVHRYLAAKGDPARA